MSYNKHQLESALRVAGHISWAGGDPGRTAVVVSQLLTIAISLRNRYAAMCSYEWANTEKYEARTERLEWKAAELGAKIGVTVEHQRDPRGLSLTVFLADGTEAGRLG